jgi:hypothetical protein
MLTGTSLEVAPAGSPALPSREPDEARAAARRQAGRVRRLKLNAVAWALGTILATALWVWHEWQANGAFERFAHEGNPGDWNPTIWALVIGVWALAVGIMALQVHFERPATPAEINRELEQLKSRMSAENVPADTGLRRLARERLQRLGRLRFHVAAWVLGLILIAPLNALIEWQDNGGFQRLSGDSQPGSWQPWMLYIGGIWALVIAVSVALPVYRDRRKGEAEIAKDATRLRPGV